MKQEKVNNIMAYSKNRKNTQCFAREFWLENGAITLIKEEPISNVPESVNFFFRFDDKPVTEFVSKVENHRLNDNEIQLLIN